MANDLDELIRLAEAATRSTPWIVGVTLDSYNANWPMYRIAHMDTGDEDEGMRNASYIAALSPDRMLPLLRAVKEAREALDSISEPKSQNADKNEHWTDKGCPERWAEVMATDTRLARAALSALDAAIGVK